MDLAVRGYLVAAVEMDRVVVRAAEQGLATVPLLERVPSLDDISRELASGTFSRRRAIKLTAGALLGSALIPLFSSSPAEARRRRNPCRGKEPICEAAVPENCKGNPNCFCARTVEGGKRGVDILGDTCPATAECDSSEDCPGDEVCICGPGMRICVSKCG